MALEQAGGTKSEGQATAAQNLGKRSPRIADATVVIAQRYA